MLSKKKGATLLELIFIITIIAVLVLIALPMFFNFIEHTRSVEAFGTLGMIRRSMNRCSSIKNGSYKDCGLDDIDIGNPNNIPGTHFSYKISNAKDVYTIIATRNKLDKGDGTSKVMIIITPTGLTKVGSGIFKNIR